MTREIRTPSKAVLDIERLVLGQLYSRLARCIGNDSKLLKDLQSAISRLKRMEAGEVWTDQAVRDLLMLEEIIEGLHRCVVAVTSNSFLDTEEWMRTLAFELGGSADHTQRGGALRQIRELIDSVASKNPA